MADDPYVQLRASQVAALNDALGALRDECLEESTIHTTLETAIAILEAAGHEAAGVDPA